MHRIFSVCSPSPRSHARHRVRVWWSSPLPILAFSAAVWLLAALSAAAQPLSVTAAAPATGSSGDPVSLTGGGLVGSPDQYFAWVQTPTSGFVLETAALQAGVLDVVVGPIPAAVTGVVNLWRGSRHSVSDRNVFVQGRLFGASEGRVFISHEAATGPNFSAMTPTPDIVDSVRQPPCLWLNLQAIYSRYGSGRVSYMRVTGVINTDEKDSDDDDDEEFSGPKLSGLGQNGAHDPRWAFTTRLESDGPVASAGHLATAVGEVLVRQFGSLGLTASTQGSVLRLCGPHSLAGGFVIATY